MAPGNTKLYYYLILLIFSLGLFFLFATSSLPFGLKIYSVRSGSMEPSLPRGSLIVVAPQSGYGQGDIITFKSGAPSKTTTHRIFRTHSTQGELFFITKGDANDNVDSSMVGKSDIVGKLRFSLPLAGYLISFIQTVPGLIFLFYAPAVFIILIEVFKIAKTLRSSS
ncbi:MAG: signal peptidase I [Patescibacteria group bacterium]